MVIIENKIFKHIHCLGIGGIGVSALAEILWKKGCHISGSDILPNKNTERLKDLGINITFNQEETEVGKADCVVYSSAILPTDPELMAAKRAKIPLFKRGQMLARVMMDYHSIAIAGAHGKTTTTAMLAFAFVKADLDPTFMVGGALNDCRTPARVGEGSYFIAEADESDASFLFMRPNIAVVTNIDADHLDTYNGDFNQLKQTYVQFLNQIQENGYAVLCLDDPVIREIIPTLSCKVITYGSCPDADYRADNYCQQGMKTCFEVYRSKISTTPLPIVLNMPGRHNAINALALIAIADLAGIDERSLTQSLEQFPGVDRRFTVCGEMMTADGNAVVVEDYGHHPNEIKATLAATRAAWPDKRITLVFQPHRYTRTQSLMDEFAVVLAEADLLVLLEVYSAGESPIVGADGKSLLKAVTSMLSHSSQKKLLFVPRLQDVPRLLRKVAQANDVILLQGAGNIGSIATSLVQGYEKRKV